MNKRLKSFLKKFLIFLIPVILGILVYWLNHYYLKEKERVKKETYTKMRSFSAFKAQQIAHWQSERMSEARFFSTTPPFPEYTSKILKGDTLALEAYRHALARIMNLGRFEKIFLFDTNGRLLFGVDPNDQPEDIELKTNIYSAVQKKEIIVGDLYLCKTYHYVHFDFLAPVFDKNDNVIAVLVLRNKPDDFLFPLIKDGLWPTETAETYIIQKRGDRVCFLSELRFEIPGESLLCISCSDTLVTAVQAARGSEGLLEGFDYRGAQVMADARIIPGTNWIMITDIDDHEIYAYVTNNTRMMSIIIILALTMMGLIFTWLYYHRRYRYQKELKLKSEQLIETGNELQATLYSMGDGVITTDRQGRIMRMNPAAEQIIEWKEADAKGKSLPEVFKLFRNNVNHAEEDPVMEILSKDVIQGFSNNITLLTRSGSSIPLAYTGSVIKDNQGDVHGIVIVFSDQTKIRMADEKLRRIEWMLSSRKDKNHDGDGNQRSITNDALSDLNENGLIKNSVDHDTLLDITNDYLSLLETSAAIYESNGDYALGIFSSGWCSFLDNASRKLCNTKDSREALQCGKWLCHESCWTLTSKLAIENNKPFEVACNGGLHIYAEPINANGKVIGAINFGFGDPPTDDETLAELSVKYNADPAELRKLANSYESRPPFMIGLAKNRLGSSAKLIGAFVEKKLAADALKKSENELLSLKNDLELKVRQKTGELQERIKELERFREATIDRELRMKELRDEIIMLKHGK
jgi:PAS domain S-box-containing protein